MLNSKHYPASLYQRILAAALLLFSVVPVWSQLTVVSTSPADGTTQVDTAASFEITFSAALDTSARFQSPENFFLGLGISPDTLVSNPDSIAVSSDLKTVRLINLHLWPNTRYIFNILAARSQSGEPLDKPATFTFTTGNALPTGAVSGTVSYPGGDPTGTQVFLLKIIMEGGNPIAATVVASAGGQFTLNYVPAGTYLPVAYKDVNKSGAFDPEVGIDAVGVYDFNGDAFADTFEIAEGGTFSGVNITLMLFDSVTARHNYSTVQAVAQNQAPDAQPVMIVAPEIFASGKSGSWVYFFYSPTQAQFSGYIAVFDFIFPFQQQGEAGDTTALPENWVDSDVAADSAQRHGGSDFVAAHPDAELGAFLVNFDITGGSSSLSKTMRSGNGRAKQKAGFVVNTIPWIAHGRSLKLLDSPQKTILGQPGVVQDVRPVWNFQYSSGASGDFLMILLAGLQTQSSYSWAHLKACRHRANP